MTSCCICHWPIDHSMGDGLNVAVMDERTNFRWAHSLCAGVLADRVEGDR